MLIYIQVSRSTAATSSLDVRKVRTALIDIFKLNAVILTLLFVVLGSGIEVTHAESGELIHTFKTAGPCEAVAWSPTRYCLAYGDLGVLRIIDADKRAKGS